MKQRHLLSMAFVLAAAFVHPAQAVTNTSTPTPSPTFTATVTPSSSSPGTVALGAADGFSVLGGAGITNTNPSAIDGEVGTFPTTTEVGFGSMTLGCGGASDHGGDSTTQAAKNDLNTAYVDASTRPLPTTIPVELGGTTLLPGVYAMTSMQLTSGIFTLDGNNQANPVFIFQCGSTLITAAGGSFNLVNGAVAKGVFFAVANSATLGSGSHFVGTIIAQQDITMVSGSSIEGRVLAMNGQVTIDNGTVTTATSASAPCAGTATPSPSTTGSATSTQTPGSGASPSASASATFSATSTPSPTATQTTVTTFTSTRTVTPSPSATITGAAGTPTAVPPLQGEYFYPSPARDPLGAANYEMKKSGDVTLKVYNQTGRLVDTVKEPKPAGWQSSQVSVGKFASGTYYYVVSVLYSTGEAETKAPRKFTVLH